jgi:hypothetical protein
MSSSILTWRVNLRKFEPFLSCCQTNDQDNIAVELVDGLPPLSPNKVERRIDPYFDNRALTFPEMCQKLANTGLTLVELRSRWEGLNRAPDVDAGTASRDLSARAFGLEDIRSLQADLSDDASKRIAGQLGVAPWHQEDLTPRSVARRNLEMNRVRKLLADFTEGAVEGVFCTYLKERTSERVPAIYCIDTSCKYVIVLTGAPDYEVQEVVCPIDNLMEIFTMDTDEDCFPAPIREMSQPEEADRMLMVVFRPSETGKKIRFCLVEESKEARDRFVQCVSILALYIQQASQEGVCSVDITA